LKTEISEPKVLKGLITSIQDYSVHDGNGLRSIVFLKGCPLRCKWCQNPESFNMHPEVAFHERLCVACDRCKEVCPEDAILDSEKGRIDHTRCTNCMKCVEVCPASALTRVGRWQTVQQVLEKVRRYVPFYKRSENGGITVSGGDPLMQPEFTSELIRRCQAEGIHTCMETCGYGAYDKLKKIADHLDLLLYDIKHIDDDLHKEGTKVGNKIIMANLIQISREMPDLKKVIRVPLVPGYNDNVKTIARIAKFVRTLGIRQIDLLPFNILSSAKYKMMGIGPWVYTGIKQQSNQKLTRLAEIVKKDGLEFTVGGLW
jgi:pyruvate formate lyase activating enzyme